MKIRMLIVMYFVPWSQQFLYDDLLYTLALTMWKYVKTSYLIEVKYKFAHNYNFNIYIVGGKM